MREDLQQKHDQWTQILSSWQESGLTIAAYCREAEIPEWKFHYWKKKLLEPADAEGAGFVEMSFGGSGNDSGIRLELSGGIRILLERGFDAVELKRTVMSLQG